MWSYHCHTMPKTKVAVSLDSALLKDVDRQVKAKKFESRSAAIEQGLRVLHEVQTKSQRDAEYLAMLALIDPDEERAFANERYAGEVL